MIRSELQQDSLVFNYLSVDICVKAKHDIHKLFDASQGPVTKLYYIQLNGDHVLISVLVLIAAYL